MVEYFDELGNKIGLSDVDKADVVRVVHDEGETTFNIPNLMKCIEKGETGVKTLREFFESYERIVE